MTKIMELLCPYCRSSINEHEEKIICHECHTAHHRDCWNENGGCTRFGCKAANIMAPIRNTIEAHNSNNISDTINLNDTENPLSFGKEREILNSGINSNISISTPIVSSQKLDQQRSGFYCINCGQYNKFENNFCLSCGHDLSGIKNSVKIKVVGDDQNNQFVSNLPKQNINNLPFENPLSFSKGESVSSRLEDESTKTNPFINSGYSQLDTRLNMFTVSNSDYYHRAFQRLSRGENSWNWAAFFFSYNWLFYRKLNKQGYIMMGVLLVGAVLIPSLIGAIGLGFAIYNGFQGNKYYKEFYEISLKNVTPGSSDESIQLLKLGGTNIGLSIGMSFVLFFAIFFVTAIL